MRWLLIVLVLVLQVQAPAAVQAMPQTISCHDMSGMADHHAPEQQTEKGQAVAHLCPGCSIPGQPPLVERTAISATCPPVATPLHPLASRSTPPRLRPPQMT